MPRTKFRSLKRKKRQRKFYGSKPLEDETTVSDAYVNLNESVSSTRSVSEESVERAGPRPCSSRQDVEPKQSTPLKLKRKQVTKSQEKLMNSSFEELQRDTLHFTRNTAVELGMSTPKEEMAHGFKLIDADLLSEFINKALVCKDCKSSSATLSLHQDNSQKEGLAEKLTLTCHSCGAKHKFVTSKKMNDKCFEVNRRSVIASMSTGGGRSSLVNFCTQMNLPSPLSKQGFANNMLFIETKLVEHAESLMCDAAEHLRGILCAEDPTILNDDPDQAVSCAVTVDGTWQKRGHTSKIGVVFVLSVVTGEILDYQVKSLVCHMCSKALCKVKDNEKDLLKWREKHNENCQINHKGSSDSMESAAAIELFCRSVERRKLKYVTYVGDGDSDSFRKVKDAVEQKYGERYIVSKEDCVGHVQKRMGTALRRFKKEKSGSRLSDGKSVGGKGRLTDAIIDKIQGYYGKAIRSNIGNLDGMCKAIWAIYHHVIKDPNRSLVRQHEYCPSGKESWCKFNKDKVNSTMTYSENHRLPGAFFDELKPILSGFQISSF